MDLGLGIVVSLKDMLSRNSGRIERSMESLDGTVARTSESMTRHLDRIEKGAMMAGAGLAMLAVPVALLSATAETQKALGELASLGVKDLRALEDAAESFTNRWSGTTKAQFLTAAYDVRSALSQLSDEASGRFTAMAALTAKATKATTDEMVGTFTTAYGIYKPIMGNMSDMTWAETFAGAMAQTVASFKTNGKQMSDAIKNIGAIAASANIPLEEQLAILGQLQTTMPGSEAGTLYKAFIMKAAEAGDKLGVSMVGANGQLRGIVPMMEAIRRKFPDMTKAAAQVEIKKAFGSDEAVKFLLQMSQGLDGLCDNIQSVKHAMNTGTTVTKTMARAMNEDLGAGFSTLRQQVSNLLEILGRTLIPVATPLLRLASYTVIGLQRIAKSIPFLTQVVLSLASAIGVFLVAAGGVVMTLGAAGIALPAIQAGIAGFGAAFSGAGSMIATYFWPVTLGIAAIAGAIVALRAAWQSNLGGIRELVESTVARLRLAFQGIRALVGSLENGTGKLSANLAKQLEDAGVLGFVTGVFQVYYRVRQIFVGFVTAIKETGRRIHQILGPAVTTLVSAYTSLVKVSLSVYEAFGLITNSVDSSSFLHFGKALGTVLGVIAQVGAFLLKLVIYPLAWLMRLVGTVSGAFIWLGSRIVYGLVQGAKAVYTYFLPLRLLVQAIRMVGRFIYGLWGIFSGGTGVFEGLKEMSAAIGDFLFTPLRWLRDVVAGLWRGIKEFATGIVTLFQWIGDALWKGLKRHPLVAPFLELFNLADELLEKRHVFFAAGRSWLLSLADGIWSAITAPFKTLKKGLAGLGSLIHQQDDPRLTVSTKLIGSPKQNDNRGPVKQPPKTRKSIPSVTIHYPATFHHRTVMAESVEVPKNLKASPIYNTGSLQKYTPPHLASKYAEGLRLVTHAFVTKGPSHTWVLKLDEIVRLLREFLNRKTPPTSKQGKAIIQSAQSKTKRIATVPRITAATFALSPLVAAEPPAAPKLPRMKVVKPGPLSSYPKTSVVSAPRPAFHQEVKSLFPSDMQHHPYSQTSARLPTLKTETLSVSRIQYPTTGEEDLALRPRLAHAGTWLIEGLLLLTQRLASPVHQFFSTDRPYASRTETLNGTQAQEAANPTNFKSTAISASRRQLLIPVSQGESKRQASNPEDSKALRLLLEAVLQKMDEVANRSISLYVKTELDGREIAEAVYHDIREQKVKNYETFS